MSISFNKSSRHFVLAAGGTGGHVMPAIGLAQELYKRGHSVKLITDDRGVAFEGRPDFLETHIIPSGRYQKNPIKWPREIRAILRGWRVSKELFGNFQPTAVVGFGGYPALPAMLAARSMGIASVIHEQNAVLGRTNRLLVPRVNAVATAFKKIGFLKAKYQHKTHLIGNPVRDSILSLRGNEFPHYGEDSPLKILVSGGSQGAKFLSDVVPFALSLLPAEIRERTEVIQQCRPEDIETVRTIYRTKGVHAHLSPFFNDIDAKLADCHLFIGRAGASTIAELTIVGRPAILVPLPIATDDHQTANCQEMVNAGAAKMIKQPRSDFSDTRGTSRSENIQRRLIVDERDKFTNKVVEEIQKMILSHGALTEAAHASWNCGRPNAASDLADLLESFGGADMMDIIKLRKTNKKESRQLAPKQARTAYRAKGSF